MNRQLIVCGALAAALATASCSNMTQSQQSTLSGAAIGTAAGVAVGAITGEWAWAAAGAERMTGLVNLNNNIVGAELDCSNY